MNLLIESITMLPRDGDYTKYLVKHSNGEFILSVGDKATFGEYLDSAVRRAKRALCQAN